MSGIEVGVASVVLIVVLIYLGLYITVSLGNVLVGQVFHGSDPGFMRFLTTLAWR